MINILWTLKINEAAFIKNESTQIMDFGFLVQYLKTNIRQRQYFTIKNFTYVNFK